MSDASDLLDEAWTALDVTVTRAGGLLVAAFCLLLASGCVQSNPSPIPVPEENPGCIEDPLGWVPPGSTEHDHVNVSHHVPTCRMALLDHSSMVDEEGSFAGAHAIAVHEGIAAVSVRSADVGHGFDLFDVSDPTKVTKLGTYRNEQARGGDRNIDSSHDGRYVFFSSEGDQPDDAGVRVIDISDPSAPRDVSMTPILPYGVHTIKAFNIGSRQFVAAINFGIHFLELRDVSGTPTLVPISRFEDVGPLAFLENPQTRADGPVYLAYGHDVTIRTDASGRTLAYFAHIYSGAYVLDVSDPSLPRMLLHWYPPGEARPYITHAIDSFTDENGRHVMVVGEETFEGRDRERPSLLWFVDITDMPNPTLLSAWQNPGEHPAGNIFLSVHYFDVRGTTVYLSHYHGGVWALDGSDASQIEVAGFYMPHEDTQYKPAPNCCLGKNMVGIPMTFDVVVDERGVVYAADLATGFYVLSVEGASNATV